MESRVLGWAALVACVVCGPVLAQAAANGPAEIPPASYASTQYVDSTGCAFLRVELSGSVNWVPRLTRERTPLCGFQPTFGGAGPAPVPAPAAAAPVPVMAEAEPVRPPVAPRPATNVGAPMETVASLTTPPDLGVAPAPSPRIVTVPAPVAAPEPRRMTMSQACAGRTGIQPNMVSASTGLPIDCGPGVAVATVAAVAPVATVAPVQTNPAAPVAARIAGATLADGLGLCAPGILIGGASYDLRCAQPARVVAAPMGPMAPGGAAAPRAPTLSAPAATTGGYSGPMTIEALCAYARQTGARLMTTSGAEVSCAPGVGTQRGMTGGVDYGTGTLARATMAPALDQLFGPGPVPASNPVGAPAVVAPPPGYRAVWDDGRLNADRGLRPGTVILAADGGTRVVARALAPQTVAPVPDAVPQVATPVAAPQVAARLYVQVGTFGDPANADRAIARLQSLGLPVGTMQVNRNGQVLRVIAAGPFDSSAQAQAALGAAHGAGFGDAFVRD